MSPLHLTFGTGNRACMGNLLKHIHIQLVQRDEGEEKQVVTCRDFWHRLGWGCNLYILFMVFYIPFIVKGMC